MGRGAKIALYSISKVAFLRQKGYAMKKRIFISLLCVFLAITLISVFASCDAKSDAMNESAMGGAPEPGEDIKLELDGSQIDSESGEYERKIIKTADISSETKNFDKALEKVDDLCKQYNAYIESSTIGGVSYGSEGGSRNARFTIRVPAEKFDTLNEDIDSILNVTSSSSNADEITSQYYDIKSRIEVLELQKESLQKMYDNYTDYSDVNSLISLQDKLFSVIEEIEAYETQIRLYDSKVAYSTINLSIREVVEYTENTEDDPFFKKLGRSFSDGWEVFLDILVGIITIVAFLLPELIVAGGIITLAVILSKKRKRRKADKRESTSENNDNNLDNPYSKH